MRNRETKKFLRQVIDDQTTEVELLTAQHSASVYSNRILTEHNHTLSKQLDHTKGELAASGSLIWQTIPDKATSGIVLFCSTKAICTKGL